MMLGVLSASCSALELGPIDNYGLNNYWNTEEQGERFITGLHYRLRSRMETMMLMGEIRGGTLSEESVTSTGEGAYNIEAVRNNLSVANPCITNWGNFYMDIYQINHAIDKIGGACTFLDRTTRNTWLGQLYGMRALYYFHLLRTYGGVPLCDYPDVLATDDLERLDKPRAGEQETFEFIKADIDKSWELYSDLDYSLYKNMNCYWNKGATACLRAEVYLWGAKVGSIGSGKVFSADPAADLLEAKRTLMDAEPHYSFNKSFRDAFSVAGKDSNKETVFAARYMLGESTNFYGNFTYNIAIFTKFLDSEGKKTGNVLNIGSGNQRYEYCASLWNSFDGGDVRRDATFLQYYRKDNDGKIVVAGRCLRKFLGDLKDGKVQYTNDVPVYRYMDIALLLAEINNELEDKAQAVKWLNVVRSRAGEAEFVYVDKDGAEEEILRERTLEFVAEGKRWYDIRRMLGGKYALELNSGNELKLLWPIDSGVLSKDSKVKQNEGYN